ncbi:MAG: APC family permease [Candidatus Micrarchaeia archaeon]
MPAKKKIKKSGSGRLKKDIGLISLILIGVGAIIGSGIFALPASMGSVAGPSFILAVGLVGIIVGILGLIYAELGSAFPDTGGPYSLPRLALGNTAGFITGWGYFLYAFTGTAAIIDVFVTYLAYYVPTLANGLILTPLGIGVAIIVLWIFTIINILGVKYGAGFNVITTIAKLAPLVIFAVVGFIFLRGTNFSPFFEFGFGGVGLAMSLGFFSFTGFESVVIPGEEVKNPKRDIPLAMIATVVIVTAVYMLISIAFVGAIRWQALGIQKGNWADVGNLSSPLSNVVGGLGFPILVAVIVIGAVISTLGGSNVWVLLQGRIPYAMAKDHLFPKRLDDVSKKYGTPALSLVFASILTTITLILIPSFPDVALIASITTLVPYAMAALALPVLRKTKKNVKRPFKLPAGKAFALIGFILATTLIYWASWPWTLVGAIAMLLGFPLYLLLKEQKLELKRNLWYITYLIGIIIISLLGDQNYVYQNFLPIGPMNILQTPYDLVVIVIFSSIMFYWGYKDNIKKKRRNYS